MPTKYSEPIHCGNSKCGTTQTPLWRKGWRSSDGKGRSGWVMLCNSCGLHYKKGHYCYHCNQIYKEKDADDTEEPWIACDRCHRWLHVKCEKKFSPNFCEEDLESRSFYCRDCQTLRNSLNNDDSLFLQTFPDVKQRRKKPHLASKASPPSSSKRRNKSTKNKSRSSPTTAICESAISIQDNKHLALDILSSSSSTSPMTVQVNPLNKSNRSYVSNEGDQSKFDTLIKENQSGGENNEDNDLFTDLAALKDEKESYELLRRNISRLPALTPTTPNSPCCPSLFSHSYPNPKPDHIIDQVCTNQNTPTRIQKSEYEKEKKDTQYDSSPHTPQSPSSLNPKKRLLSKSKKMKTCLKEHGAAHSPIQEHVDIKIVKDMFNNKWKEAQQISSKLGTLWAVCEYELQKL